MRTRALGFAAILHAGGIALACGAAYQPAGGVQPMVALATRLESAEIQVDLLPAADQPSPLPEVPPPGQAPGPVSPLPELAGVVVSTEDSKPVQPPAARAIVPEPEPQPRPIHTGHFLPHKADMPHPAQPSDLGKPTPRAPDVWISPGVIAFRAPRTVRRGFRGKVLAVIQLSEQGRPQSVVLETGTGNPDYDELLKRAFFGASYYPATLNGLPIRGQLRQPLIFE